jgi:hypothetical protein
MAVICIGLTLVNEDKLAMEDVPGGMISPIAKWRA